MAPWRVTLDPQVDATLHDEEKQVRDLCPTDPEKLASHPRLIAHRALNRRLLTKLPQRPDDFSYSDKACGDEVRFTDAYGWRLIITIDREQGIVRALYLARIEDPYASPRQTFDEWKNKIPPAKSN